VITRISAVALVNKSRRWPDSTSSTPSSSASTNNRTVFYRC